MWRLVATVVLAGCGFEHGALPDGSVVADPDAAGAADGADPISIDAPPTTGVIARWEFDETGGSVAADTSNVGTPLDLTIDTPANTAWGNGALEIKAEVRLRTTGPATKIIDACRTSGAVTIEAWVVPADDQQGGPARIVTMSSDIFSRNLMLAQEGATWQMRLRTSATDGNGTPTLGSGAAIAPTPALAQLVLTEDATDRILYVDGEERVRDDLAGSLAGWTTTYPLLVANEEIGATGRAWLGSIYRIVVYDRRLTASEIATLFTQGP